jgi:hypothetical protein
MNPLRSLTAVAALTLSASSVAVAQTCIGRPDLTVMRGSLGAEAQFADDVTAYEGRVGLNNRQSFGNLSAGYVSLDNADNVNATTFGVDVGVERHLGTSRRVHVCPIVAVAYQNGPNIGADKASGFSGSLSGALGISFPLTPTVSFVPFASAGLLSVRSRYESSGLSMSETETGGLLGVGASFRFNSIFALTPSVAIPVGFDDSDTIFSLGATIGFRRR